MPDRFHFGNKIGSGGFGVVSHATRARDGLPFAVKHLVTDLVADEEALRRFRREVRIQRGLEHPNILPVIGASLSSSPPWFIMPIADRTLADEGHADLTQDQVERIYSAILDGLEYAHTHGVIHRDLKPENILMTHDGTPQIADFGLGKNLLSRSTEITQTTVGMGSFPYVAPEQMIDVRDADERSDIFALGKVLQFMLSGKVPLAPPAKAVERKWRYLIEKATEYDADARYHTVSEVRHAFDQVLRGVERPKPVRETVQELIAQAEAGGNDLALSDLLELLNQRSDDVELYRSLVPTLSDSLLRLALRSEPLLLKAVLEAYDAHVTDRSLNFDYCDVVADFYRRVYFVTDDLHLRKMVLACLLGLGPAHNRWHVRDVVAALLTSAQETSEVMMAVDVLREKDEELDWFRESPTLRGAALAPPIDEALFG